MNAVLVRLLTRLYPRAWGERYGAEFEALLIAGRGDLRTCFSTAVNVAWSAFRDHIFRERSVDLILFCDGLCGTLV
jgi:hypothetical protein